MRFAGTCYRAHDPKWAFSPLSGAGARVKGGRFNPVGRDTLYLALTMEGLLLEVSHGFAHRFDPLTLWSYDVDVADIVDLRTQTARDKLGVTMKELGCAWALDVAEGREPASRKIAAKLMKGGAAGILVPSFARGARPDLHHNLVLWTWGEKLPHRVVVHDPESRLPRDQSSWT